FLSHCLVELLFGVGATGFETAVPDVERLERASEPLRDQLRDLSHEWRGKDALEHLAHSLFGNLPVFVETPGNERRRGGRVGVGPPRRPLRPEEPPVPPSRPRP